jgi:hypothetical protein
MRQHQKTQKRVQFLIKEKEITSLGDDIRSRSRPRMCEIVSRLTEALRKYIRIAYEFIELDVGQAIEKIEDAVSETGFVREVNCLL